MREINIVGYDDPEGFERSISNYLFKDIKLNKFTYDDDPSKIDRPLLIYSHMGFGIPDDVANFADRLPNGYLIYHRSNEFTYQQYPQFIQQKVNLYKDALHVFRPYWMPSFDLPNVTHIPLFWGKGYENIRKPSKNPKKFKTAMIGAMKSDRAELLEVMKKMGDCFHFANQGWLSDDMINPKKAMDIYNNSVLSPSPMGGCHPSCFRLCEILNSGGIPVLKEYWNRDWHCRIYGFDSPIPFVKSWNELPEVYNNIIKEGVYEFAMKLHLWWYAKRIEIRDNFQNILLEKINV
jgi:hypothetical protein